MKEINQESFTDRIDSKSFSHNSEIKNWYCCMPIITDPQFKKNIQAQTFGHV